MIHNFRPSLIRRAGLAVNRCSQLNVDRNCLPFQRTDSTFGRRLVSTAPIKVGYSGYETSQFLDPQKDKVLLERCVFEATTVSVYISVSVSLSVSVEICRKALFQ